MHKEPNRPRRPTVIEELHERGLTLIHSEPDESLLSDISEISKSMHRGTMDGSFGLATDRAALADNQADCVVYTQGGFSFLRITGRFIDKYTNVMGLVHNAPEKADTHFLGDEDDFLLRTFDQFGYEEPMMPYPIYESAQELKKQLEQMSELSEKAFKLCLQLGLQDLFNPRLANDFVIEFPLYETGSVVDSTIDNVPVHQHDETDETVVAIQITENDTGYVAGKSLDTLETFSQRKGDLVVLDSRTWHGPVPQTDERMAVVIIARGPEAREILHRGLEKLGHENGWEPTSPGQRTQYNVTPTKSLPPMEIGRILN
ncbi:MAG: cupin domain-containing protein [Acidimicrobiia bacterium]